MPGTPRHKPETPRKPRPTRRPQTPSRVIHAHDEHPSRAKLLSDATRSKTKICPGAWRARRSTSSGRVFLPPIPAIIRERVPCHYICHLSGLHGPRSLPKTVDLTEGPGNAQAWLHVGSGFRTRHVGRLRPSVGPDSSPGAGIASGSSVPIAVGRQRCRVSCPFANREHSVTRIVPVVDLFSGPGGLAEGFAAFRGPDDRRRFRVALSIENDRDAHRTLQLRAFLRRFATDFPPEYYDFLNGSLTEEPDWEMRYPARWAAACDETRCLELGTSGASTFLRERLETLREEHRGRTVLLGGPPCQSYSVIGRSRNAGNTKYDARTDKRLSLYRQYARALARLRPAVAVMENVKGLLSAKRNQRPIFPQGAAQSPPCRRHGQLPAVRTGCAVGGLPLGRGA